MLVYEGVKSGFINDVNLNLIVDKIYSKYKMFFGKTSDSQLNSWKNSMQYVRNVLDDDEIPNNSGVAIEFNIPTTSKRIDFILSGKDSKKNDSVIIIELKQWEKVEAIEGKDGLVSTYTGGAVREVAHPSYQAMSYANLIKDFNETVELENINLYPCAFLHNYDLTDADPINSQQYQEYIKEAPMFGSKDFLKLRKDRKSTRLNSSHQIISYADFCLKKKKLGGEVAYTTRDGVIHQIGKGLRGER